MEVDYKTYQLNNDLTPQQHFSTFLSATTVKILSCFVTNMDECLKISLNGLGFVG